MDDLELVDLYARPGKQRGKPSWSHRTAPGGPEPGVPASNLSVGHAADGAAAQGSVDSERL